MLWAILPQRWNDLSNGFILLFKHIYGFSFYMGQSGRYSDFIHPGLGSAAAGLLQQMEKGKEQHKGPSALLEKNRAAASSRAKLKAALEREIESNQLLQTRVAKAVKTPEQHSKSNVSTTITGQFTVEMNANCLFIPLTDWIYINSWQTLWP